MRSFFKTWLTICLLLPLAAHATNREQRLPNVNGYTPKSHVSAPSSKNKQTVKRSPQLSGANSKLVPPMATKESSNVLSRAVNVLGTPYRWGGSSPSKGFDCSGLVKYAFNDATFDLPRTSNAMASGHGEKVDRNDLKPGDLIFFKHQEPPGQSCCHLPGQRSLHPRTTPWQVGEHRHLEETVLGKPLRSCQAGSAERTECDAGCSALI